MTGVMPEKERISSSKVRECLHTKILGRSILYFRTLTSTNHFAKLLAARNVREGIAVVAETQSRGKGRLGRKWVSPEGGLWFSIILRPPMRPRDAAKLTLLGSVAVAKTISELYELKAEIKWPNDILINQRKLCGILTEGEIREEKLRFAVAGFGLNANFSLEILPKHLRELATTLSEQLGKKISREILLCNLLQNADEYYEMLSDGKFETILNDWRRLSGFLGSYVEIAGCREKIEGWAVDLDNDGALIVRLEDQTTRRVISGEVTRIVQVKRPAH